MRGGGLKVCGNGVETKEMRRRMKTEYRKRNTANAGGGREREREQIRNRYKDRRDEVRR